MEGGCAALLDKDQTLLREGIEELAVCSVNDPVQNTSTVTNESFIKHVKLLVSKSTVTNESFYIIIRYFKHVKILVSKCTVTNESFYIIIRYFKREDPSI